MQTQHVIDISRLSTLNDVRMTRADRLLFTLYYALSQAGMEAWGL